MGQHSAVPTIQYNENDTYNSKLYEILEHIIQIVLQNFEFVVTVFVSVSKQQWTDDIGHSIVK